MSIIKSDQYLLVRRPVNLMLKAYSEEAEEAVDRELASGRPDPECPAPVQRCPLPGEMLQYHAIHQLDLCDEASFHVSSSMQLS